MKELSFSPTDAELEVLQWLWQRGPLTVRQVNDKLNMQREVGYTTTLKIMQIMLDKGLVSREIIERSHIYTAIAEEKSTQAQLLKGFVGTTFRGSSGSLVLRALGEGDTTPDELQKIKEMIANIESLNSSVKGIRWIDHAAKHKILPP